ELRRRARGAAASPRRQAREVPGLDRARSQACGLPPSLLVARGTPFGFSGSRQRAVEILDQGLIAKCRATARPWRTPASSMPRAGDEDRHAPPCRRNERLKGREPTATEQ